MRRKPVLASFLAVVIMGAVPPLSAQESSAPVKRGEALLTRNCARCHASRGRLSGVWNGAPLLNYQATL
jgi:mono/diheme cytochrome c family protein